MFVVIPKVKENAQILVVVLAIKCHLSAFLATVLTSYCLNDDTFYRNSFRLHE